MSGTITATVDLEGFGQLTEMTAVRTFAPDKKTNLNRYEVTVKRVKAPPRCPVELTFIIWHDTNLGVWDFIRKVAQRVTFLDSGYARGAIIDSDLIGDAVFAEEEPANS